MLVIRYSADCRLPPSNQNLIVAETAAMLPRVWEKNLAGASQAPRNAILATNSTARVPTAGFNCLNRPETSLIAA